ncbi:[NiFe]-hydrogenase assembly chaperone HybE [Thiospirillum jenense]|uniref:[NiFe]-hydrogenase assembly chaperone HybE n=1 Tax=Thiospirillum jenense TaxID=1653858 RepID=UPI001EEBB340|nr:[NiFe]-hydrogenase assembly chaperone HybE [Thiospirillum jenense]
MSNGRDSYSISAWQRYPDALHDDQTLIDTVLAVHTALLSHALAHDPLLNLTLPIEQRALRRIEDWRLLLLLTPWMLSRLLFPDHPPSTHYLPTGVQLNALMQITLY